MFHALMGRSQLEPKLAVLTCKDCESWVDEEQEHEEEEYIGHISVDFLSLVPNLVTQRSQNQPDKDVSQHSHSGRVL